MATITETQLRRIIREEISINTNKIYFDVDKGNKKEFLQKIKSSINAGGGKFQSIVKGEWGVFGGEVTVKYTNNDGEEYGVDFFTDPEELMSASGYKLPILDWLQVTAPDGNNVAVVHFWDELIKVIQSTN